MRAFGMVAAWIAVVVSLSVAAQAADKAAAGRAAFERGDYSSAARMWRSLAEQGDAEAQFGLGVLFAHGRGVVRNYRLAAQWYERAANQGHAGAQFALGFMYYTGAGATAEDDTALAADFERAARWLIMAAENDVAMAQHLIAGILRRGIGVPADPVRAYHWTVRAANHGVVGAQYDLGLILSRREGDRYDPVEGYKWFALAARHGYPGARHNLGVIAESMSEEQILEAKERLRLWQSQ